MDHVHSERVVLDDRIRVTASIGRLTSVELDPRTLRLEPHELARRMAHAINAALSDTEEPAVQSGPAVDSQVLTEQLQEASEFGLRQLSRITSSLQEVMAEIRRDGAMAGSVAAPDFASLLDQTSSILKSLSAPSDDTGPAYGRGEAADGLVVAACVTGSRLESLSFGVRAMQAGSHELATQVVTAVNAAFDDLRRVLSERRGAAEDPAELTARVRDVQRLSVEQMSAYGQALRTLMANIEPGP